MGRDNNRHGDYHRARGAGDLAAGATEHRCEEPHRDRAVHAGSRPQTGRHAKGQRHGQRHDHGSNTAKQIAAQGLQIVMYTPFLGNHGKEAEQGIVVSSLRLHHNAKSVDRLARMSQVLPLTV